MLCEAAMVFAKQLREGIRRGIIRCTIRVWQHPRVKVGGSYKMDDGHVVAQVENEFHVVFHEQDRGTGIAGAADGVGQNLDLRPG